MAKLGYGGMAEAWRARLLGEAGFTKSVFIKKVLPEYSDDYAFTSMLISEARISATLTHSNIAQVFDLGRVENEYFLAMEYVEGQSLYSILERALNSKWPAIPEALAVFIGAEICRGLHYAHTRKDESGKPLGIVHRDISPENVLISYEGQVKIIDFGLAKARDIRGFTTEPGVMKGKYLFFSPEQARGEEVDALTDVWATGVLLYELLCGKLPLEGPEYVVLPKLSAGQFPRPRQLNPRLSEKLEEILMGALTVKKEHRYRSCQAFGEALTSFLHSSSSRVSTSTLSHLMHELFREEMRAEGREVQVPRSFTQELAAWRGEPRPAPPVYPNEPEEPTVPVAELLRLSDPQVPAQVAPVAAAPSPAPQKVLKLGKWSLNLGPAFTWKWSVAGGTALAWMVLGLLFLFVPRAPSSPPAEMAKAAVPSEPVPSEPAPPVPAPRPVATEKPSNTAGDYARFIQQARASMTARRYPNASENYRMALKLDAESLEAKEGLGVSLVLAGIGKEADEEAAKLLREVVNQDASKARAWFGLGMALQLLRDEDEAATAYKYYLTLEPSGAFAMDARRALKQLGED
ncbi:MAG TPA: protein kinase [Myxococcaceae bacterium]